MVKTLNALSWRYFISAYHIYWHILMYHHQNMCCNQFDLKFGVTALRLAVDAVVSNHSSART